MTKRPNPKKDRSVRRRRPGHSGQYEPGRFTAGLLDPDTRRRINGMAGNAQQAPPDSLPPVAATTLWTGIMHDESANVCVDACLTIGYALAQFGIATELRAVDLAITDSRTEQTIMHGTPEPRWDGNMLEGHCVLTLPEDGRYIDATVEQFPQIARLRLGPIVARFGAGGMLDPATGALHPAAEPMKRIPAGGHFLGQRQHMMLLYTLANDEATKTVLDSPVVQDNLARHRRAGINLAALTLAFLRAPSLVDHVRKGRYGRLHALLDAVGDAPLNREDASDCRFLLDGTEPGVPVDELPLPAGVPAEATGPAEGQPEIGH